MIWLLLIPLSLLAVGVVVYLEASGRFVSKAPHVEPTVVRAGPEGLAEVEAILQREFHDRPRALLKSGATRLDLLADKRRFFDEMGDGDFNATFVPAVVPAGGSGEPHDVPGEWVLVDGHDPDLRLLYLHGGGFTVGSARSHRPVTVAMARELGAAVFVPDYRLMPENTRLDGIADARAAFRWLAAQAPDGARPARALFVAGDSAGGSLSLMVAQWARDVGARDLAKRDERAGKKGLRAPDAVAVFSPSTDYTLGAGSVRANFDTDTMLQPLMRPFLKLSRPVLTAGVWKATGMRPSDPRNSPLFGDLADLPPTLVQVSETEMLLDDARNYAARATAAGSDVELEVWRADGDVPLPHVWHMFPGELPAAREAVGRAAAFLRRHAP